MVLNLFAMMNAHAQFINPVTPDELALCTSNGVAHTGTSAYGDLQVVVVDGSDPSIVFVDYSTTPPSSQCFPLQAVNLGARVSDPDVVWDYSGSGFALVVYEADLGGVPGIWSEMWDWNGGTPVLATAWGAGGIWQFMAGGVYPNVDADIDGNAVVVWERGGAIEAMTVDFPGFAPSGNVYLVNDAACGFSTGIEPDVAIRSFDGKQYVNFVMVDQSITAGDIAVVFESFTIVQAGFANSCATHTVQHAGGVIPTGVSKPRIDMDTYSNSINFPFYEKHSCSVVYELIDVADNYIGSSQLYDYAGNYLSSPPPYDFVVYAQTYTQPAHPVNEWISDILNDVAPSGLMSHPFPAWASQINPPVFPYLFKSEPSFEPVTNSTSDGLIYVGWNWRNTGSLGFRPLIDEVISRRLVITNDGNSLPVAYPVGNTTLYWYAVPAPVSTDYYVVGEGYLTPEPQSKLSLDGTQNWSYYAFIAPVSGRIFFKRTLLNPTAAVRIQKPKTSPIVNENKTESIISVYPNPNQGQFWIKGFDGIVEVSILDAQGRKCYSQVLLTENRKAHINAGFLSSGIYTVLLTENNGKNHRFNFAIKNQ